MNVSMSEVKEAERIADRLRDISEIVKLIEDCRVQI
jgi:hypothetical protein